MSLDDQQNRSVSQPAPHDHRAIEYVPTSVRISDIYLAAMNRAIHDHELDKLFNPDFDDFQI